MTGHFGFVFEENSAREILEAIIFEKFPFKNVFIQIAKPTFSNSSGLKSVFEKLRFRDGLVWTVGQTVEIKLRFQISRTGP